MKFVTFDLNGMPIASVNDYTIHELPEGAFEVNDEQFERWFDLRLIDNNIVTLEPPAPQAPTQQELLLKQILSLEAEQDARRIREAVLGIDNGWLANLNSQIAALRAQLS